jgi:UDP-glucose 4-epimerase
MANVLAATVDVPQEAYGAVYNIGNGANYSVKEIANMISENQTNVPPRLGESKETLADNSKVKNTFGWDPKISISDWINENKY